MSVVEQYWFALESTFKNSEFLKTLALDNISNKRLEDFDVHPLPFSFISSHPSPQQTIAPGSNGSYPLRHLISRDRK